ncbi:Replication factor C, subunit 1 [Spironucleus salmonicida]|uniref:Replication factor C, subunit 1 n=1 Tax=Spironucleus salmonicida TaxID=348837 RepID=V6LSB1_9EUKA|nr:Replication factor C, subunit 1 [Spironucleus salmonicida]|eukprot:EST47148.1 Replication factor C, subunit 1 [Spironucleus salmonicida]
MKQIKFTAFDEDVLDFNNLEIQELNYLDIEDDILNKRSVSIIEQQLLKTKMKSQQISDGNVKINEILIGKSLNSKYDTNDLELGIDIFNTKETIDENSIDPFNDEFSKLDNNQIQQKKKKQIANHSLLRPRGFSSCLDQHVIFLSGQNPYFTDEEFKKYIQILGGKLVSSATTSFNVFIMGNSYNQNHLNIAQSKFAKRLTIDGFFNWIVTKSINSLIQGNSVKKIIKETEISEYINNLNWVSFNESLQPISILEIVQSLKEQNPEIDNHQVLTVNHTDQVLKSTLQVQQKITKSAPQIQNLCCQNLSQNIFIRNESPIKYNVTEMYEASSLADIFHSKVPIATLQNELKFPSKPIILSGCTGSGKFTIASFLSQLLNYSIVMYKDNLPLVQTVQQFNSILFNTYTKRILYIKEIEFLDSKQIQSLTSYLAKNNKISFPIILATSDSSNQKLRILKKYCNEIKLQKPTTQQITEFCDTYQVKNEAKKYLISAFDGDIRQLILNLQFYGQKCTKIVKQLNSQEILQKAYSYTENKLTTNLSQLCDHYFIDPQMIHCSSLANYQELNNYQTKQTQFFADIFSLADCQIYKMYSQGDWSGAKSAQLFEIGIPALLSQICPNKCKLKQFGFLKLPYSIIGLNKQCQAILNKYRVINSEQVLCEAEYVNYIQSILQIIDGSFAFGIQSGDESIGLKLSGQQYLDLIDIYEQNSCSGRSKKELINWLDQYSGIWINLTGKKKTK